MGKGKFSRIKRLAAAIAILAGTLTYGVLDKTKVDLNQIIDPPSSTERYYEQSDIVTYFQSLPEEYQDNYIYLKDYPMNGDAAYIAGVRVNDDNGDIVGEIYGHISSALDGVIISLPDFRGVGRILDDGRIQYTNGEMTNYSNPIEYLLDHAWEKQAADNSPINLFASALIGLVVYGTSLLIIKRRNNQNAESNYEVEEMPLDEQQQFSDVITGYMSDHDGDMPTKADLERALDEISKINS